MFSRPSYSVLIVFVLLGKGIPQRASDDLFPRYPVIEPNIRFWEKVFVQWSREQAAVHDAEDLDVVYRIIDLVPHDAPGAYAENRRRKKAARNEVRDALIRLADASVRPGEEERRLASLFGDEAGPSRLRRAAENVRVQQGLREKFRDGLVRSGAWLDEMRRISRDQGIPEEICYLPHVESSFNPRAYSKFGASGIWQFMPSTGKQFLRVDYTVDERSDPIKSTVAAAKFHRENFEKLGSWPLALTAYNHGTAGMLRAQRQWGDYPEVYRNYRSRSFGFASRNFYSEFLAAWKMAEAYRDHFPGLVLNAPVKHHEVILPGYAPIDKLSAQFGVDLATLRRLNPALRDPVFKGQKFVPKDYALVLPSESPSRQALVDESEYEEVVFYQEQKRSHFHRVQRGETAGRSARRHGVGLRELIEANDLSRSARIYPGQNLRIPGAGEKPAQLAAALPAPSAVAQPPRTESRVVDASTAGEAVGGGGISESPPSSPEKKGEILPASGGSNRGREAPPAAEAEIELALATPGGANPLSQRQDAPPVEQRKKESQQREQTAETTRNLARGDRTPPPPEAEAQLTAEREIKLASLHVPKTTEAAAAAADNSELPGPLNISRVPGEPGVFGPLRREDANRMDADEPELVEATTPADPEAMVEDPNAFAVGGIGLPMVNPEVVMGDLEVLGQERRGGEPVGIIVVEPEETIGHYAEWLGVTAQSIRNLNRMPYRRAIRVGQKLRVPLHKIGEEAFVEQRYEYHKALVENFFSAYRVEDLSAYAVQKGDNIWNISHKRFEVPFWLLRRFNPDTDLTSLQLAQVLRIPNLAEISID